MLMLSHAREITRAQLSNIPTPGATDSWRPVPHIDVVEAVTALAADRGLRIRSERYAVTDGALHPQPGIQIDMKGARLFGSMDFAPVPGMPFPAGCTPSAGIRNSHDKTFALSILSGARVFVCANGVLAAEHIVSRKHTSRLNLHQAVDFALDEFMRSLQSFNAIHQRLNDQRITRTRAHSLVVEMARAGAFSSSDIVPVVEEFENSRHPEFRDRTAWTLYQAATETMKKQSPARQTEGFKALNAVLVAGLN
jgi:Domain of unknown function (DUF932)